jgi:predicted metal-dependent peptidase
MSKAMKNQLTHMQRVKRARFALCNDKHTRWTAPLLLSAEIKIEERECHRDGTPVTFFTDGLDIWFSPRFVDSLKDSEVKAVLLHEAMHKQLVHSSRQYWDNIPKTEIQLMRMAMEFAVNYAVEEVFGLNLPKDCVKNHELSKGKSTWQIFQLLKQAQEEGTLSQLLGGEDGQGEGGGFVCDHSRQLSEEEKEILERAVASASSILAGDEAAGELRDFLNSLVKKVDWRELLQDYLIFKSTSVKQRYSYRRPDRRALQSGDIAPSADYNPAIRQAVVAFDASGSISHEELSAYLAYTKQLLSEIDVENLSVYSWDTKAYELWSGDVDGCPDTVVSDIQKTGAKGGGGTDPDCLLPALRDMEEPIVVVFTDGVFCSKASDEWEEYGPIWCYTFTPDYLTGGVSIHVEGR